MSKILSVIIPSYKFVNYIEDCIESIFKQITNFDFDVIVRDDGSDDGTKEKLLKLEKKFNNLIVLNGDENIGGQKNIKKLIDFCTSKYIAYLDGDDMFGDSDKLQRQVDFLESNPEYVMHFTGCRYLNQDGSIFPNDSRVISSVKKIITTKDLLENNYAGFGRVFRNIPNIIKDYFNDIPYVDWPLVYELSKYGDIYYEEFFGGLYRISSDGIYSTLSEEEKQSGAELVRKFITNDYMSENMKPITIIDCFIHTNDVLNKLRLSLHNLKKYGNKILLVTNTAPPQDIIESVDFLFYNTENKLFEEEYENVGLVDLWKAYDKIVIHEVTKDIQRHGLSVMCNLFNSLDIAKSLGYTHFQRIEVDDLFTDDGYEFMMDIPKNCLEQNKKSLFYINEGRDISFHYFFSEIDFFLNNVNRVRDEKSYRDYVRKNGYGSDFINVEKYVYNNLLKTGLSDIIVRNGESDMNSDFPNTLWNSISTQSNLPTKFNGCSTKIYMVDGSTDLSVLSFNYNDFQSLRRIVVCFENYESTIHHRLDYDGAWMYNIFEDEIKKIKVYDDKTNEFLYEIENKEIWDKIEFR
jgi:glycosyltransferase involved in cell wall biosynthesis